MTAPPPNPPAKQPNPFYLDVLRREIANGGLRTTDRVLVTCGGNLDRITHSTTTCVLSFKSQGPITFTSGFRMTMDSHG
jgi:hypothetical protein